MHGKHKPESHSKDRARRGLKLPQKAAVASAVRVQPMATPADVRRSLNIVDKARRDEVYISPSKGRAVGREVAKVRCRNFNDGWPLQLHFDSTGGISDSKIDILGITTDSLCNRSNPVCLCIANQEDADGYEFMYESMEAGLVRTGDRTIASPTP